VHSLGGVRKVFAGQRAEGFYVDLGSIFDLGNLRPFQPTTTMDTSIRRRPRPARAASSSTSVSGYCWT
jgi:hypothetical protein